MLRDTQSAAIFDSLARFTMGNGRTTLWKDRRIMGRAAGEIAPLVTAAVNARCRNRRLDVEALLDNKWIEDISAELSQEGVLQCIQLGAAINGVRRDVTAADTISWPWSPSG